MFSIQTYSIPLNVDVWEITFTNTVGVLKLKLSQLKPLKRQEFDLAQSAGSHGVLRLELMLSWPPTTLDAISSVEVEWDQDSGYNLCTLCHNVIIIL